MCLQSVQTRPCANLRFYTRSNSNSDCACALRAPISVNDSENEESFDHSEAEGGAANVNLEYNELGNNHMGMDTNPAIEAVVFAANRLMSAGGTPAAADIRHHQTLRE